MAVAALWLVLFGVLHATTDVMVLSLFSIAPLIAATVADERRTAVFAGAAVALAIGAGWWDGITGDATYWTRVAVVCAISAMAVVVAGMRRRREERLARMTAVAEAAQLALLPPLPPEMTGSPSPPATAPRHARPRSAGICMRSSPPGTGSG